jgi:DHA1 family multidrug resistance protein-like MFS transporter
MNLAKHIKLRQVYAETINMKPSNRNQILILSFALIVVMLGFGMVVPIFPFFIEELGASGTELGLLVATASLLEFIFGPIWGGVSDRTGRKPILALGIVGYALSMLFFGLSTKLWMLFASRALSGVLSSATISVSLAYVSDSTSEDERGGGMGKLGAAMAFGIILGPAIGGWLAGDSLSTPFFVGAGLAFVALMLIVLFLPESLPPTARQHTGTGAKFLNMSNMRRALLGPAGIILLMVTLFSFALTNFEAVFGLYALVKFDYGPERVGTILAVVAVVSTVGKAAFTGPATKRFGEATVIKASALAGSVGFIVLLLANTYVTILLATGFFILSKTLLRPAAFALISRRSTAGHGAAMGLSNSFMSLGRIAGPIWAGFIFDVHVDYPYLSGSLIMFIGFLASMVWITGERPETVEVGAGRGAD